MIQRVYERARMAHSVDRVLVATDDERILAAVRGFGGEAVLTSGHHTSGTDRLAEAVAATDAEVVVNVQGDEPLLDPAAIDAAVAALRSEATLSIATISEPLLDTDELSSPNVVKVIVDAQGNALYFSRSAIPYLRFSGDVHPLVRARATVESGLARKHVGLYVYRREALLRFAAHPPAPLEQAEALEQLRALHYGMRIRVVARPATASISVDTPADLERARALVLAQARI